LGKFWSVLQMTMLVYFMAISSILMPFGKLCGHLVWLFGIFFPFYIVRSTKKNLATLVAALIMFSSLRTYVQYRVVFRMPMLNLKLMMAHLWMPLLYFYWAIWLCQI
jgi:hypothetical protein